MGEYFVTGTDTGVGKSLISAALLRAGGGRGWRTVGLKPVAAGAYLHDGKRVNADALLLQSSATVTLDYGQVNPVTLLQPMAPHLAAAQEGRRLDAQALADHCRRMAAGEHDLLLAEGAGGWLVPLNDSETMADVARLLGWPVILVVGMRLGCLNHALLTAAAVRGAGLSLAGWVANSPWPPMAALDANIATLEARLPAARLGSVPWLGSEAQADTVVTCLDLSKLARS